MNHTPSPLGLFLGTPGDVADGYAGVMRALGGQVLNLGPGARTLTLPVPADSRAPAGAAGGSR